MVAEPRILIVRVEGNVCVAGCAGVMTDALVGGGSVMGPRRAAALGMARGIDVSSQKGERSNALRCAAGSSSCVLMAPMARSRIDRYAFSLLGPVCLAICRMTSDPGSLASAQHRHTAWLAGESVAHSRACDGCERWMATRGQSQVDE